MKTIARLSILAAALFPAAAFAGDINWTNPGASSWFLDTNWSPATIPTDEDSANVNLGTAQVDAAGAVGYSSYIYDGGKLLVQGGTLSLDAELVIMRGSEATVTGTGSSLTSAYLGVAADGGGVASLTISDGAHVNTVRETLYSVVNARIGGHSILPYPGGTGTVTVTGTGSQWRIDNNLEVGSDRGEDGYDSHGTLNVLAGGKVAVGVYPLTDPEATNINVGYGARAGTTGQVTVSGAGSELSAYAINLGGGGLATGTLTVADSGLVKATEIQIGSTFGGTGHVYLNGAWDEDAMAYQRGTLEVSYINPENGSLEFNGGLLRATSENVFADWDEDNTTATFSTIGQGAVIDTNDNDLLLGMKVTGNGQILKQGEGELGIEFTEDSTFTGVIGIEEGKLRFHTDFDTSNNELLVRGGEVELQESHAFAGLSGFSGTSIYLNDHTMTVNMPDAIGTSYEGDISGDGSFVKGGNGTLFLSGNNTWGGTTTVSAGVLRAGSATALPQEYSTFVVTGGTLDLNGNDLIAASVSGTGGQILLGTAKLTLNQENDTTLASAVSGAGKLVKNGGGKVTLTGANTFTETSEFGETVVVRNGTLAVSGAGGSLAVADSAIFVGHEDGDIGTFEIRDGASVTSKRGYVGTGPDATGHVVVTGAGSKWTGSTSFAVGYSGTGTLEISNGGSVTTSEAIIGHAGTGSGSAIVTGSGSSFNSDILYVGNGKYGELTIADGGTVTVDDGDGTVIVGANEGVTGLLWIGGTGGAGGTGTAGTLNAAKVEFRSSGSYVRFEQANATTFSANIVGPGRVVQIGFGTTTLTGVNTYTGLTTVEGGRLLVNGSITSDVLVSGGAVLGGSGSVGGITLDDGAALTPGGDFSLGTLNATSFTWDGGAAIGFDLGATTSDLLNLSGAFTKSGTGTYLFSFRDVGGWQEGHTYTLIDFGSTDFSATDFSFGNAGGFNGSFAFDGSSLTFTLVAIPEPSTYALGLVGLLALVAVKRRQTARRLSRGRLAAW